MDTINFHTRKPIWRLDSPTIDSNILSIAEPLLKVIESYKLFIMSDDVALTTTGRELGYPSSHITGTNSSGMNCWSFFRK